MKWLLSLAALGALLALPLPLCSQRAGGRPGGVSRPGGAGIAAPTFSRPMTSRPMTVARPSGAHLGYVPSRPTTISRPMTISRPPTISRPTTISRPSISAQSYSAAPMIQRPQISAGTPRITRPTTMNLGPRTITMPGGSAASTPAITRPSTSFAGTRPITRPSVVPKAGSITGAGAGTLASTTRPAITRPPIRPSTGTGGAAFDRPNIAARPTRPGLPGGVTTGPSGPGRPGGSFAGRPSFDIGRRPIQHDLSNINVSHWNQYGHRAYYHRPWYAGYPGYRNYPWYANRPAWYWNRPWYNYHWHWHHGYWNYWITPPAFWLYGGLWAASSLWPAASYVYYNPYYVQPTTYIIQPTLDYSLPIAAPIADQAAIAYPPAPDQQTLESGAALPTTPPPEPSTTDPNVAEANRQFETARSAFKAGNYAEAQRLVEKAIEKVPSDATLHEFRALTLFAQGRYKEEAAALYAVLAAGPGWDWQTMYVLYGDESAYTRQLRALEDFVRTSPDLAEGHFVLAYQYLVMGHKAEAVKQLQQVVRIQPDDKLSAALLKALTTEPSKTMPEAEPPPVGER